MHFLIPPFLVLFSLLDLSDGIPSPPPTVLSTYPQLKDSAAKWRYYHEPMGRGINIRPDNQTTRPDFQAYIAQLTPIDRPTPVAGYVEIVTISDREYFILQHGQTKFSNWTPMAGVYRVTPERVEYVLAAGPEQMLFPTQIGMVRWCYEYDSANRLSRTTYWAWGVNPQTNRELYTRYMSDLWTMSIANRLLRPPRRTWIALPQRPAAETLYDYWPTTGALRTITETSRSASMRSFVRHFDESGNELKEQP